MNLLLWNYTYMQRLTLWAISLTSQAFCTNKPHLFILARKFVFSRQMKWFLSVNKEHIRIFHFWHNKVPAWEVMLLKHLQGKYGTCIRNVRKLRSERSQAMASGSGITRHAIIFLMSHISIPQVIFGSKHDTWKPAGRFWARGSKQKRLGIEASCFRDSACGKVKSKSNPLGYFQMFWECFKTRRNPPIL